MPFRSVVQGIFQVGGEELTSPSDCCVYLVDAGSGGSVLVDAGLDPMPERLFGNMEEAGFEPGAVKSLIITHCHIDHIGGAPAIVERSGCEVVAHEGDLEALTEGLGMRTAADMYGVPSPRIRVDRVIEADGGTLNIGEAHMVIVHTPGHTPGTITLLMEVEGRTVAFANDVHGPFRRVWGSDVSAWRRSMNRLIAEAPDVLLEGHYGVLEPRSSAIGFIQQWLDQEPQSL